MRGLNRFVSVCFTALFLAVLLPIAVFANVKDTYGDKIVSFDVSEDKNSYVVAGIGKHKGKDLVIPDEYNGKPVTAVDEMAFYNCKQIESITIGKNITQFGTSAFKNCENVKEILYNAKNALPMEYCTPFVNCGDYYTGLKLVIGKDVEKIPDHMFASQFLQSVTISELVFEEGSNCKAIGNNAFGSSLIVYDLALPEGLEKIGEEAFTQCSEFIRISLPATLKEIGYDAFSDAFRVVELYNPSSVKIIAGNLDNGRIAQNNPVIHTNKNATSIIKTKNYFWFCTKEGSARLLAYVGTEKSIVLPDSYEGKSYEIESWAFEQTYIESVTIPAAVKKIGSYAFHGCQKLKYVNFADPIGWNYRTYSSSKPLEASDLRDSVRAAEMLTGIYDSYTWIKGSGN